MSEERRFSREFKLAALARMAAGENVSALARELGVRRKYLYQWRERFRAGGAIALRGGTTAARRRASAGTIDPNPTGNRQPHRGDGRRTVQRRHRVCDAAHSHPGRRVVR